MIIEDFLLVVKDFFLKALNGYTFRNCGSNKLRCHKAKTE